MSTLSRSILTGVLGGLLLVGCTQHATTKASTPVRTTSTTSSSPPSTPPRHHVVRTTDTTTPASESTGSTGIAACDDYLSSYLACHRAAQIYPADQLQSRYEAMRSSLLRDAKDPDIRPQLRARCNSLATQLRQVLDGKSCASTPAPATSTP